MAALFLFKKWVFRVWEKRHKQRFFISTDGKILLKDDQTHIKKSGPSSKRLDFLINQNIFYFQNLLPMSVECSNV